MNQTQKTGNQILTVEEVAEFLKVHSSTIYKLLKHRQIPAFRVGADWRFHSAQIEEWVKSRTRAPEDGGQGRGVQTFEPVAPFGPKKTGTDE